MSAESAPRRRLLHGLAALALLGCAAPAPAATPAPATPPGALLPPEPPPGGAQAFRTDFSRHTVPYEQILPGGPPKDGIPAIDQPRHIGVAEAGGWLAPQEPVVLVQAGGAARAYPVQILIWHEIVNDSLGGTPIAVTFCPLCNTAIVFERRVGAATLDFGTTGMLRYSNLIMYDRQSESWWQQATGAAIAGQYAGERLAMLPAAIVSWAEFARAHPDGSVLSRDTGHVRSYGANPYPGYDAVDSAPFLYDGPPTPGTLPATARVLGVELGGEAVAYPYALLEQLGAVSDSVGGEPIVVIWQAGTSSALDSADIARGRDVGSAAAYRRRLGGRALTLARAGGQLRDAETGTRWDVLGRALEGPLAGAQLEPIVAVNHLWFSWVAFQPGTRVYQP